MKSFIVLLILSLGNNLYSQDLNYTEWQTVYKEDNYPNEIKVEISFMTNFCNGNDLHGYSFYKIRNEFNRPKAWVKFKFDYTNCDGTVGTVSVNSDMSQAGIDAATGNWFTGYKVIKLYDIKYEDFNKKNPNSETPSEESNSQISAAFNIVYTKAIQKLNALKQSNPGSAANYENSYGATIGQIQSQFKNELLYGANQEKLHQYKNNLDEELNLMNDLRIGIVPDSIVNIVRHYPNNQNPNKPFTISTGNNSNNTTTNNNQKQAYQNQADNYLNKAQSNSASSITNAMNLDLAKTNAIMAGNQQQVQQIQQQQNQQNIESNQKLFNNTVGLFNAIQNASAENHKLRSDYASHAFRKAEAGDIDAMKEIAGDYLYGNKYKDINEDRDQSILWYRLAVDKGDICSLFQIESISNIYSENLSKETKVSILKYLCSAYFLYENKTSFETSCKTNFYEETLRFSITDAVYYQFLQIKDNIGINLLQLFNKLFNDKIKQLNVKLNYGNHQEKREAKNNIPIVKDYINQIQTRMKEFPDYEKVEDSVLFSNFVGSNVLPGYLEDLVVESKIGRNNADTIKNELPVEIKFDGIYGCLMGDYINFLRFYPDGTVLNARVAPSESLQKSVEKVNKLIDYYSSSATKGKYQIKNNKIYFLFSDNENDVFYVGSMSDENRLVFTENNSKTKSEKVHAYKYLIANEQ